MTSKKLYKFVSENFTVQAIISKKTDLCLPLPQRFQKKKTFANKSINMKKFLNTSTDN